MLADALAHRLGYRCIDRGQLIEKAAVWGASEDELRSAIEKPPSFLGQSQHKKYLYLTFIQAALTEEARAGNMIYHGLAGHLLLGRGSHVLRTRIIAPMEFRISKVQDRLKYHRKQAIAYIEKRDEDRRKWTRFLYGMDWTDASLYDIVLNLEQMTVEDACDVVCFASQLKRFEFTLESQRTLDDLATATRVKAHLAMDPATSDLEFEVVAQAGSVSIKGEIASWHQARDIDRVVRTVAGVTQAHIDQLAVVARI
jgi:cytidylate kinase